MCSDAARALGDIYIPRVVYPSFLEEIMSIDVQNKWDARYQKTPLVSPVAAEVLVNNVHLLPESGDALDLACGLGGNALLLAKSGLRTSAWDISPVALKQLDANSLKSGCVIKTKVCDVVSLPPCANSFDVMVVSRFLDRSLFPALIDALRPDGVLFYQTFTRENVKNGGPSNPSFLLEENELLTLFAGMKVLSFRDEGRQGDHALGLRNESWIVVKKTEVKT